MSHNQKRYSLLPRGPRMSSDNKLFSLPIVKFRRGDKARYEDLQGEIAPSPNRVEFQTIPAAPLSPDSATTLPDDTFTVDQAVDAIGFGLFQIKLSLFTGIVWMSDAMEMMVLSILAPALHCYWGLSPFAQALLTTVVFAGMFVSSGFWGWVCDKYGRKVELILCSTFTFYFGLLSSFAPNYIWLLILRGLTGFGIGGVPQSVTLYAEFLPSVARAKCVVMIEIFWAIGTCFIVVIAIFVMPALGWRYLLVIAAVPLLVFAVSCVWLPESARYDLASGRPERALATLQRIAKTNNKPMPLGRLVATGQTQRVAKRGQLSDLFTGGLFKTTLPLWFIWFANAFSYYGIVLMTTELFEVGDTCHGGDTDEPHVEPACWLGCKTLSTKDYTDLLWTTVAEFPGLFITFLIIEWLGRKRTMALEFFVFSIFVFLVNMCTTRTVLTLFLFVARAFISGAFQAAYVYTPEVYPTTFRALGLGSCSGMARIGALVTPFVAQVALRSSVYVAINVYGGMCILGAIASLLLPIETKGRTMEDTHEKRKDTEER